MKLKQQHLPCLRAQQEREEGRGSWRNRTDERPARSSRRAGSLVSRVDHDGSSIEVMSEILTWEWKGSAKALPGAPNSFIWPCFNEVT